jgi:hypothetical protein
MDVEDVVMSGFPGEKVVSQAHWPIASRSGRVDTARPARNIAQRKETEPLRHSSLWTIPLHPLEPKNLRHRGAIMKEAELIAGYAPLLEGLAARQRTFLEGFDLLAQQQSLWQEGAWGAWRNGSAWMPASRSAESVASPVGVAKQCALLGLACSWEVMEAAVRMQAESIELTAELLENSMAAFLDVLKD